MNKVSINPKEHAIPIDNTADLDSPLSSNRIKVSALLYLSLARASTLDSGQKKTFLQCVEVLPIELCNSTVYGILKIRGSPPPICIFIVPSCLAYLNGHGTASQVQALSLGPDSWDVVALRSHLSPQSFVIVCLCFCSSLLLLFCIYYNQSFVYFMRSLSPKDFVFRGSYLWPHQLSPLASFTHPYGWLVNGQGGTSLGQLIVGRAMKTVLQLEIGQRPAQGMAGKRRPDVDESGHQEGETKGKLRHTPINSCLIQLLSPNGTIWTAGELLQPRINLRVGLKLNKTGFEIFAFSSHKDLRSENVAKDDDFPVWLPRGAIAPKPLPSCRDTPLLLEIYVLGFGKDLYPLSWHGIGMMQRGRSPCQNFFGVRGFP